MSKLNPEGLVGGDVLWAVSHSNFGGQHAILRRTVVRVTKTTLVVRGDNGAEQTWNRDSSGEVSYVRGGSKYGGPVLYLGGDPLVARFEAENAEHTARGAARSVADKFSTNHWAGPAEITELRAALDAFEAVLVVKD